MDEGEAKPSPLSDLYVLYSHRDFLIFSPSLVRSLNRRVYTSVFTPKNRKQFQSLSFDQPANSTFSDTLVVDNSCQLDETQEQASQILICEITSFPYSPISTL